MIIIKNRSSIIKMEQAGKLLASVFDTLGSQLKPGVSTLALDQWIGDQLKKNGLVSQAKGYKGYKHYSCISINQEVVHGVPSEHKILADKDVVKVDVCAAWKGYCADMARTYCIGDVDPALHTFVAAARRALQKGIEAARVGNRVSDISFAVQSEIEKHGFGIVRDFAGHGIGKNMHEEPEILNYGDPGKGPVIRAGMAFAIEPMITMGKEEVCILNDGWTVETVDRSMAAHVEDTVIVTEDGPKVLTKTVI